MVIPCGCGILGPCKTPDHPHRMKGMLPRAQKRLKALQNSLDQIYQLHKRYVKLAAKFWGEPVMMAKSPQTLANVRGLPSYCWWPKFCSAVELGSQFVKPIESSYRAGLNCHRQTNNRFYSVASRLGLLHFRFEDIAVQHAQHVKGAAQLCRDTNKKQSHCNGVIGISIFHFLAKRSHTEARADWYRRMSCKRIEAEDS